MAVIIPAAGLSTRMGSTTSGIDRKQLLEIGGAPILIHTLRKFDQAPSTREILVAVRPEDNERVSARVAAESFRHPVRVVEGGLTRQESVWNALQSLPAETELVGVHDAVRPFIDVATIERAAEAARQHGAAIVALPAVDTVKQVEQVGGEVRRIVGTLPRERIALAQTPQVFRYDRLRKAFEAARQEGFKGTDEAAIMEHCGFEVMVVPGSPRNFKITTPSDLELAQLWLSGQV